METARLLIEHGADKNAKSKDGKTALMIAGESGYREIVELLKWWKEGSAK
jgi:ankyrin repeat protein